jgi:hypothetical protein
VWTDNICRALKEEMVQFLKDQQMCEEPSTSKK